jgi:haloalkane dehalogenase
MELAKYEKAFDRGEYPFESRFLPLPAGSMHYVDEGSGRPFLLVHGTPSWSFEFRGLIRALRSERRVIAPDHLGFGLSARPTAFSYSLPEHTENLRKLIADLRLETYDLLVHDFGGPIALPLVLHAPERIGRLVILNSWLWPMGVDPQFEKGKALLDSWLMRLLYLHANFSAGYMVKASWGTREPLTAERHRRFKAMFPDKDSRIGTWAFARSLVREEAYLASLYERIDRLRGVPTQVLWGTADKMVGEPHLARWRQELPNASFVELPGVGHFPQEEAAQEVVDLVRRFLGDSDRLPHARS